MLVKEPIAKRRSIMHAKPGDTLVIESRRVDQGRREATIVEARSADGSPPYLVRWPDGHEGLVFPGPDAHVAPAQSAESAS
jgi:hypothetical protein